MPFSTSALPVRAHAPQSTCGAAFPAARGGRIPDLGKNGPEAEWQLWNVPLPLAS